MLETIFHIQYMNEAFRMYATFFCVQTDFRYIETISGIGHTDKAFLLYELFYVVSCNMVLHLCNHKIHI